MTTKPAAALAGLLVLASFTLSQAGNDNHHVIKVKVDDGSSGAPIEVRLDSRETGFVPADLAVGETRTIQDDQGRNILVTRTDDGLTINVDGREIVLPEPPQPPEAPVAPGAVFMAFDSDESVTAHDLRIESDTSANGATVIVGPEIDEAARNAIRDAILATGAVDDVSIIGSDAGKEVRVIKVHRTVQSDAP